MDQQERQDVLNQLMSTDEASKKWGLSAGHIKNLCAQGKIMAVKIGPTWVLHKDEPRP